MTAHEETPLPRDDATVIDGTFYFRVDGGEVASTTVRIELWPGGVLVRYGDGVPHVGLLGDDVVEYFATGLAPSLRSASLSPSPGP